MNTFLCVCCFQTQIPSVDRVIGIHQRWFRFARPQTAPQPGKSRMVDNNKRVPDCLHSQFQVARLFIRNSCKKGTFLLLLEKIYHPQIVTGSISKRSIFFCFLSSGLRVPVDTNSPKIGFAIGC